MHIVNNFYSLSTTRWCCTKNAQPSDQCLDYWTRDADKHALICAALACLTLILSSLCCCNDSISWQADHSSQTWAHMHIAHNSLSATSHRNTPSTDNRLISAGARPLPTPAFTPWRLFVLLSSPHQAGFNIPDHSPQYDPYECFILQGADLRRVTLMPE